MFLIGPEVVGQRCPSCNEYNIQHEFKNGISSCGYPLFDKEFRHRAYKAGLANLVTMENFSNSVQQKACSIYEEFDLYKQAGLFKHLNSFDELQLGYFISIDEFQKYMHREVYSFLETLEDAFDFLVDTVTEQWYKTKAHCLVQPDQRLIYTEDDIDTIAFVLGILEPLKITKFERSLVKG